MTPPPVQVMRAAFIETLAMFCSKASSWRLTRSLALAPAIIS